MNRKVIFGIILIVAMVVTMGTFAYTYVGATTATLNTTLYDEDAVTIEEADYQPNWESILPDSEDAAETIYPAAAGDATEIYLQSPLTGEHWDKVDDTAADDWETYVSTSSSQYQTDLYDMSDATVDIEGAEIEINSVTIYYRVAGNTNSKAKPVIKTHNSVFEGTETSLTATGTTDEYALNLLMSDMESLYDSLFTYTTESYTWVINPYTSEKWTWDEVNDLQAGISLRAGGWIIRLAACTQVYVKVNYEYTITEGAVPEGDLYDITPHSDFTGDFQVKIYLVNTGDLLKAYSYLNMEIYIRNSVEAESSPRYRLLSLENGVATFNIEGGTAESYTVEVWGGGYYLKSDDSDDWSEGWSITPEFYCEIAQR